MSTFLRAQHLAPRRLGGLLALALAVVSGVATPGHAAPAATTATTPASPATQKAQPAVGGISARALDAQGKPLSTAYFDLQRKPGSAATVLLDVTNHTDRAIPVDVGAVDATTSDNGGTAFRSRSDPRTGVGSWLSPGRQSVTLGPRATTRLHFKVSVPPNVSPGDHVGGIVVEPQRKLHLGSTADITRVVRLALAVRVLVPGPVSESITASNLFVTRTVAGGPPIVSVNLANDGDLMCKPTVTSTFSREGTVVSSERRAVDTLLPGTKVGYQLGWTASLPEDTYDVQFQAEGCGAPSSVTGRFRLEAAGATRIDADAPSGPENGDGGTGAPRWVQIAAIAGVLLLFAALGWWFGSRPKRRREHPRGDRREPHRSGQSRPPGDPASTERPLTQRNEPTPADNTNRSDQFQVGSHG